MSSVSSVVKKHRFHRNSVFPKIEVSSALLRELCVSSFISCTGIGLESKLLRQLAESLYGKFVLLGIESGVQPDIVVKLV